MKTIGLILTFVLFFAIPAFSYPVTISRTHSGTLWQVSSTDGLIHRAEPSRAAQVYGVIPYKTILLESGRTTYTETISGKTGCWVYVRWMNQSGWVFGAFLEEQSVETPDSAFVRKVTTLINQKGNLMLSGGRDFSGLTYSEHYSHITLLADKTFEMETGGAGHGDTCPYCNKNITRNIPSGSHGYTMTWTSISRGGYTFEDGFLILHETLVTDRYTISIPHDCPNKGKNLSRPINTVTRYKVVIDKQTGKGGFTLAETPNGQSLIWVMQ